MQVGIERWATWEHGTEPDVSALPPLLRRRCSRLTRMMLHAALRVASMDELAGLPVVFGSRHGEMAGTVALLRTLARREPPTAAAFSHSVHNAPVGLLSIASRNRQMASAVSAGADTFGAAFLETVASMHRGRHDRGILVVADDALPEVFASFEEAGARPYAVAAILGNSGMTVRFEVAAGGSAPRSAQPQALQFVEWLESAAPSLTLGTRTAYTWRRLDQTPRASRPSARRGGRRGGRFQSETRP